MRIRTIRPEFYESETIGALSWDARLVFISLWSYAEDNGVNRDNARLIRGTCFAYDADVSVERIEAALDELESAGCIRRYTQNGKRLLWIPNFHRYQKIDRPSLTHFTPPEDGSTDTREYSRDTSEYSTPHHDTLPTHSGTVDSTDTREYSMDTHETPASTSENGRNKPKTSDEKKDSTDTREYSRDTSDRSRSGSSSRSNKRNSPYRESKESAARFDAPPASTGVDDSENESVDARSSTTVSAPKSTSGKKKPRKKSSKPKPEAHDGQGENENAPAPSDGNPIHDWEPSPAHYELAAELGVDCNECADGFVDWTLREGRVWDDTEAAFRMWMRREKKFKDRDEAKSGSASGSGVRASRMVANAEYNRRLVEAVSERQKQLGQAAPAYSEEDFR